MAIRRDRVLRSLPFLAALAILPASDLFRGSTAEVKPFSQNVERALARVVYFGSSGVAGELWMDYGRPRWSENLESEMDKPANKRWRFGSDVWTSFESFVSLKAAGVSVPAGHYYAVIEHPAKDKWSLVLLAQKEIRAKKLDAFAAGQTTGGIMIPLTAGTGDLAERLTIKLNVE